MVVISTKAFLRNWLLLFGLLLPLACQTAHAEDIIYFDANSAASYTRTQIELAADFFGLTHKIVLVDGNINQIAILKLIQRTDPFAVIISADALSSIAPEDFLAALKKSSATHAVAVMIAGVSERTDGALLKRWSGGEVSECRKIQLVPRTGLYRIAHDETTAQLGGTELPLNQTTASYLIFENSDQPKSLMAIQSDRSTLPVFAKLNLGGQKIFFATATQPASILASSDPYREPEVFATLGPQLIFLRWAAGERAWHSPGRYANLTIDDVWLREPYGHLHYEALFGEMQQHNFHTTLAFVPWNFDRSQPGVASLIRLHSEKFSICIHGNN